MSAPGPQVRVTRAPFDRQPVIWECGACGKNGFVMNDPGDALIVHLHEKVCPATKLAALKTDLRDLVTRWQDEAARIGTGRIATPYAAGRIDCADELERAIGGGE